VPIVLSSPNKGTPEALVDRKNVHITIDDEAFPLYSCSHVGAINNLTGSSK
jgi:hypothetical protein